LKSFILLTIGIPTYNGGKYLRETVESVVARIKESNRNDIEILISENASTDQTRNIAKLCALEFAPFVNVIYNSENIGFDRNIDQLFKNANGRYVEILGDDDFLEPGHFDKLLAHLEGSHRASAIILGVSFLDISTGKKQVVDWGSSDYSGLTGNDFFRKSLWRSAAISAVVIETIRWESRVLQKYYGTQWIHIAGLMHALAKDANGSILCTNTVVVRVKNDRWQTNFGNQFIAGLQHLALLESMIALGYSNYVFNIFVEERFRNNLRDIISICPIERSSRIQAFRIMFKYFKRKPTFWILHIPAIICLGILRPVYNMAMKTKRFYFTTYMNKNQVKKCV